MSKVQLYDRLIKATEQIVTKFGKDVLTEDRFVNILQDLYPDRDNPAVFRIVKSMINDGFFSELMLCNKGSIHNYVSKTVSALNQKYGYDKVFVEGIIYSIAVGCGAISQKDINSSTKTPAPSKSTKPTPAKPKRTHNPKQPNKPTQKHSFGNEKIKGIGLLILSFLGLFLGTFLYILYLVYSWWMLFTLLFIMVVHIATILPGVTLYDYQNKKYSSIFSGVLVFVCLNYLAPLLFVSDFIEENVTYYCGKVNLDETSGIILCIFVFCFLISIFQSLLNSNFFKITERKEFVITFFCLSLIYGLFLLFPELDKNHALSQVKNRMAELKNDSEILQKQRSQEKRDLQFMGVNFQMSRLDVDNIIKRDTSFTIKETWKNNDDIEGSFTSSDLDVYYKSNNYRGAIDYVLCTKTLWDNKSVFVDLFFNNDSVVAIKVKGDEYKWNTIDVGSVVPIYTKKYGEPELEFNSLLSSPYHKIKPSLGHHIIKDKDFYKEFITKYCWSYANGGIEIVNGGYRDKISITYVSSKIFTALRSYEEKKQQKELIRKKREIDSLKLLEKKKNEEKRKKELLEEQNHKNSINQI